MIARQASGQHHAEQRRACDAQHAAQNRAQKALYAQRANAQLKDDHSRGGNGAQDSCSPGLQVKGAEEKTGRSKNNDEEYADNNQVHTGSLPMPSGYAARQKKVQIANPRSIPTAQVLGQKEIPKPRLKRASGCLAGDRSCS
jgi:hypothetical protein